MTEDRAAASRLVAAYDDSQNDQDTLLNHIRRAGGFAQLAAKWGVTPEELAACIKEMRDPESSAADEAAGTDPPRVKFHRSTWLVVAAAACLGIAVILGAVWYILVGAGW